MGEAFSSPFYREEAGTQDVTRLTSYAPAFRGKQFQDIPGAGLIRIGVMQNPNGFHNMKARTQSPVTGKR